MNIETEQKIEAVLAELRGIALKRFKVTVVRMATGDEHPSFVAVATIHKAARAARKNAQKLLDVAVPQTSSIIRTLDAHNLLKRALTDHLSELCEVVEEWRGLPLPPSTLNLIRELFTAHRQDLLVDLDARRDRFKNQGGRPPSWNWDAAEAHLKSRFPSGFVQDQVHTEVAEVLIQWFESLEQAPPERSWLMEKTAQLINEHRKR